MHCNELEMKLKLYSHITGQNTVQLPLHKFEVICFFPDLFALSYKIYFKNHSPKNLYVFVDVLITMLYQQSLCGELFPN